LGQHQFKTEWLALLLGPPMGQMKKTIEIATLITDLRQKLTNTIPLFETPITTESKVVAPKIANTLTADVASSPTEQIVSAVKADSEEKTSSETATSVVVLEQAVLKKTIEKIQEIDLNPIVGAGDGLANERLTEDYNQWLSTKINASREWLAKADKDNVSIQVMMRRKTAARELVLFLKNDWPLDLKNTYLYEVQLESQTIYRVFYREFDSMTEGYRVIKQLPESVRLNGPYLQSVYQMQASLLN
jgi:septal ring-binding cell division protein DamX